MGGATRPRNAHAILSAHSSRGVPARQTDIPTKAFISRQGGRWYKRMQGKPCRASFVCYVVCEFMWSTTDPLLTPLAATNSISNFFQV